MVGRTRLYRSTGSPLISGRVGAHRRRWPTITLLVAVVLAVAIWVYLTYLR